LETADTTALIVNVPSNRNKHKNIKQRENAVKPVTDQHDVLLCPYSGEVVVGESAETLKAMDVLMENDSNLVQSNNNDQEYIENNLKELKESGDVDEQFVEEMLNRNYIESEFSDSDSEYCEDDALEEIEYIKSTV